MKFCLKLQKNIGYGDTLPLSGEEGQVFFLSFGEGEEETSDYLPLIGGIVDGDITAHKFKGDLEGNATTATSATNATNASNADKLGGLQASDYAKISDIPTGALAGKDEVAKTIVDYILTK